MTKQLAELSQFIADMKTSHDREIDELRNGMLVLQKQNQDLLELLNSTLFKNSEKTNYNDYQYGIFILTMILVVIGILHLIPNWFWTSIVDRVYAGARRRYVMSQSYRRVDPEVHRRRRPPNTDDIELSDTVSRNSEH